MAAEGASFPSDHRLRLSRDFSHVFADPCRSTDPCFTVLVRPNGRPWPRLGIAVSRRRLPHATARNRVRRIVRESFRTHLALLAGLDLVVIARDAAGPSPNTALFASLERHWKILQRRCAPCLSP